MYRVFDDRYPEVTLYESEDRDKCIDIIDEYFPVDNEAFAYIWIEKVGETQ